MQAEIICDEAEDLMPLNETDKAWIREAIRDTPKLQGWGKVAGFIKEWGGTGAAVAIILFALAQWNTYTEFRVKTGDRLDKIETDLKEIKEIRVVKEGLLQQHLAAQASLPLPEFNAALPAVKSSITTSRTQGIIASPQVVDELAHKLSEANRNSPDFWSTASEFINYKSYVSSPQRYVTIHLPNCDPHPARDLTITTPRPDGSTETLTKRNAISIVQENCFLDLDVHNEIEDYSCHGCVVKYSGGSLTMKAPIEFKDCLFVFSIKSQPPTASGLLLAESLLSQNPKDIKISAS